MSESRKPWEYRGSCINVTDHQRFWEKVDTSGDCWEWQAYIDNDGYGTFKIDGRHVGAHRAAFTLSSGDDIPDGKFVLHHCDNPSCVRPSHLYVGTNADNMRDRASRSRGPDFRGERNPSAKLTARDVRWIRKAYAAGLGSHKQLGERFGVVRKTVSKLLAGHTWT